jgi:hypothetical protein
VGVQATVNPFGGSYIPDPLAQFLSRVVPWAQSQPPEGYVNIHAFGGAIGMPYRGGGRAFGGMDEYGQLQDFVGYLNRIGAEVFYCISAQATFGEQKGSSRKPLRRRENATLLRALVLDLDVKPTGYASQRAALAALLPFFDSLGIKPGFIVSTGRGLHAYIVLDAAVQLHVWQALADRLITAAQTAGLKFDVGVTRDAARILRLPTSFNRKEPNNPLPCSVLGTGPDTGLAVLQQALSGHAPTPGVSTASRAKVGLDPKIFPPRPPITYGPEVARVSADREKMREVTSIDLLRSACPVVADSDARGGDGDREPLWFELAKLCHYVQDGRNYFHDLSSGDGRYDEQATDRKFDIAQPQGWPACATIAAASPSAAAICRTCAFNGQGQSPVNYAARGLTGTSSAALPTQAQAPAAPAPYVNGHAYASAFVSQPLQSSMLLPPGYKLDPKGFITTDNGEKRIFDTVITNMEVRFQQGADDAFTEKIYFTLPLGTAGNTSHTFAIAAGQLSSTATATGVLQNGGIWFQDYTSVKSYMSDWQTMIRENRRAHAESRLGWAKRDGLIEAFCYGGVTYDANGGTTTTMAREPELSPRGTLVLWRQAANFFVGKGCVEMETIMAGAFAAPLVEFTAVDGLVLFARSSQSGMGKTASLEILASVWGSRGTIITAATEAATMERIAALNNLPVIFDELVPSGRSGANVSRRFGELILQISAGKEKNRLDRSSRPMQRRTSQTMMIAASNYSLTEIASGNDSNAQAARVLEIEMSPAIKRLGVQQSQVAGIKKVLDQNYGTAAVVYSEFLGKNHASVALMVDDMTDWFQKKTGATEGERFWIAAAATLFVGATLSQRLGLIDFDIVSMQKFLLDQLRRQRATVQDMSVNSDDPDMQLGRIRDFVNSNLQGRIVTDTLPGQGWNKSAQIAIHNTLEVERSREFISRLAIKDMLLMVSEPKLKAWCRQHEISYRELRATLEKHNYCTRPKRPRSLGSGTRINVAQETVLVFDLRQAPNAIFLPDNGV